MWESLRILLLTQCRRAKGRARQGIPWVIIHDSLVDDLGGGDHEVVEKGGHKRQSRVMMRIE